MSSPEPILHIKPNLLQESEAFSSKLYSHPNELWNSLEVNELLESVPCIGKKYPSVLDESVDERRAEFLQDLKSCAEFKTAADNKFKLVSNDEVLTRNNHLVQKYDQMLEQNGSITRFPTLYSHLQHSSTTVDHSTTVDQLVKKLNIEEPVKEVAKDLHSSSPNMVSLIYNLSTAFCREQILDCIKRSSAKSLDQASFVNLSTCLGGSCTAKVLEYLSEKSHGAQFNCFMDEDDDDEERELVDLGDDDEDEDDIQEEFKPINNLTVQESIKQFEHEAITKIGYEFNNLNWKNNFYKRFLTLIAYLKDIDSAIWGVTESLLKPLDDSKVFKLNNLLKKWKLSKLLSSNIFEINEKTILFFNDDGIPYVLRSIRKRLILDNTEIMKNIKFGFDKERITKVLPQLDNQQDQQVLCDVMCGLFPSLVEQKKKLLIKRPPSAYIIFVKRAREKITQENPTMTVMEISKKMAYIWKDMNGDDKQFYVEQAIQEKLKYQKQKEEFVYCISGLDENVN
ncbi:predicted protein [Naegleria gruberi]|uniref:Predicted protein n=1 Tax=Naegleria gruberi TaxID=5762 RepID=D2VJ95_NAEGR|nr:uncharacterized protein NAEGRDRAFT_50001 [Naegleria gruberi]EFC43155.1 predicted protein [Naegleria gruberi]|eukprot:XP_002675899.1 predicted protein [Naegleria gruberi strain NEG-M]